MDIRAFTFLSSLLLLFKCFRCQSSIAASSVAVSETVNQPTLQNRFTVPAVIKPVITYDTSNLVTPIPKVPSYNIPPLQQPLTSPYPVQVVYDNASGGSNNNILNLIILLSLLKNNGKGSSCCGGCGNGGCGGSSCGGCYRGRYNNYENPYGNYPYGNYENVYCDNGYYSRDIENLNAPIEIIVNGDGYIEEPVLPNPSYSNPYPLIKASPGKSANEIIVTITTNYPCNDNAMVNEY